MSSTSYVDKTASAIEHCEQMANLFPDLAEPYYEKFATYCQQKLWHQLTCLVLEFVSQQSGKVNTARFITPEQQTPDQHTYLALYENVVMKVDQKLNPLSLARIGWKVAAALAATSSSSSGGGDAGMTAAMTVLENLLATYNDAATATTGDGGGGGGGGGMMSSRQNLPKDHPLLQILAKIYVESKLGQLQLQSIEANGNNNDTANAANKTKQLGTIKHNIKKNELLLHEIGTSGSGGSSSGKHTKTDSDANANPMTSSSSFDSTVVFAAHYQCAMTYYKCVGPPELFYRQALLFLNYAPVVVAAAQDGSGGATSTTNDAEMDYNQLAIDLCLAAMTGDGVYNLGQVEQNTILTLLTNTPNAWLVEILHAMAAGDVSAYQQLTQTKYATQITQHPVLVAHADMMKEKLSLLALMSLIFSKESHDRNIAFDEIQQRLQLTDVGQVEWVVMRALSVGLMEGYLDQVDAVVHVKAVMPRILNTSQVGELAVQFGSWAVKCSQTKNLMMNEYTAGGVVGGGGNSGGGGTTTAMA